MDLFFATEVPEHPVCTELREMGVEIIPLAAADAGFLDSRRAALEWLKARGQHEFVLPMQEDFLLEGRPISGALDAAARMLAGAGEEMFDWGRDIASARLMPCPGPASGSEKAQWWQLQEGIDTYGFTFQATLWRLDACLDWYQHLCSELERKWPRATTPPAQRIQAEVRTNFAENADGQRLFWAWSRAGGRRHLAWVRSGPWPNAVYLSPWPYRPTAIVRGRLEPWAEELAAREGVKLHSRAPV